MDDEILDLIDENDKVVGEDLKGNCHKEGLWHRAVTILVFNKNKELLIQKRSQNVPRPNLLCASASGHVQKGESYESAAKRELKEELGIECKLKSIGKFYMEKKYPDDKRDKEHYKIFLGNYDGEFNIQKEELSSIQFLPVEEIKHLMKQNKNQFTPGFQEEFQHYLEFKSNKQQ
ncbi:NUDIX domain-containing protein [Candidatus Micrarchaeota archaeon]|nr:NUDIX domain-containing protein [Candidatus Micrarchaeota archaeon]MBU1930408.1 NUDIX domain-containing protein [Candidatus Micrarchaeota archaeon]